MGTREDSRIDAMFSDIVQRQGDYMKNIHLLSKIGCILPDTGLRHMICYCRKVVLMGEKRMCKLMEKILSGFGRYKNHIYHGQRLDGSKC